MFYTTPWLALRRYFHSKLPLLRTQHSAGYTDFWVHLLIFDGLYVNASHVPQNQLLKPLLMVTMISHVAHLPVHNTFNPILTILCPLCSRKTLLMQM